MQSVVIASVVSDAPNISCTAVEITSLYSILDVNGKNQNVDC